MIPALSVAQRFGLPLKRSGNKYIGRCPFHADTDPSFTIYPDGYYHCFGCKAHGDGVNLYAHLAHCSIHDALTALNVKNQRKQPDAPAKASLMEEAYRRANAWRAEEYHKACVFCLEIEQRINALNGELLQDNEDFQHCIQRFSKEKDWRNYLEHLEGRELLQAYNCNRFNQAEGCEFT